MQRCCPFQINQLREKAYSSRESKSEKQGSPRCLDQRRNSEKKLSQHLTETPSCEGRPSRPRRQRGIGAQAKSQLCRPTARHRRALVIGLGRAYARFTVVSAVGTRPPHDGHSGASTVECAVQEGGNPERGMTSPTSPAGTSRSSGSTEHGDGQSPHGAYLTTELPGAGSQVPANVAALGLKSAPFFHIACMTTAILRATATAARLKPRRFLRARPHRRRSLSPCTRVSMVVAAS